MQTVVYDRWYLAKRAQIERQRTVRRRESQSAPRPRLDKREADPRRALAAAAERRGTALADLSRMIERPAGYLGRFVREGVPRSLRAHEHRQLAAFFGVEERGLGIRQLWQPIDLGAVSLRHRCADTK